MANEVARVRRTMPDVATGTQEIMTGGYAELLQRIGRGKRRGEYGSVSKLVQIGPTKWAVKVARIKPEPPRWQRPLIVAGSVLSGVMLACAGLAMALGELMKTAGAALSGVTVAGMVAVGVVLCLAALIVKGLSGKPRVSVRVDVR